MPQTMGIDLASKGRKTSVCVIDWQGDGKAVVRFPEDARYDWTDSELIKLLIEKVSAEPNMKVGIDCPFGWPSTSLTP